MKFNLKIVAAAAAVAMMSTGAAHAAGSIAVSPLTSYTYSLEGLQLSGAAPVTLPDIVVTFGNNLTYQDDVFITFAYSRNKQSPYAKYSYDAKGGGFGGLTVGETWTYHHGDHGKEASRGLVDGKHRQHPILRGVADVFGPTDVYGVNPDFPADATVLLHGLTLTGMNPDDPPNLKKAIMPLVWLRQCTAPSGKQATILCSTIGAAVDFKSEDLRRLIVNASFFLTGLEVPARADATPVGEFNPTYFGYNSARKGVRVEDQALK
ncbi:MAG TPA: hypothetical protein P5534_23575 [Candidatus Paceibacterota bacterium]|nr:hypothetical protein [Candidatus Paceibacterota bacterium]